MTSTSISILNSTMSDDTAVAELFKRQKHFAADKTLSDSVRLQGQAIFNTALFTDIPAAAIAGLTVVTILRQTIESIGALYLQNEKRKAVLHVAESGGDKHEHSAPELQQVISTAVINKLEVTASDDEQDSDDAATADRIAAAMAARQKRRLATHGAKGRMSAAAGVLKALQRTSRGSKPAFTGTNNLSLNNKRVASRSFQVCKIKSPYSSRWVT